jgi:hypothetical protein
LRVALKKRQAIQAGIHVIRFARLEKSTEPAFSHQPSSTLIERSRGFGSVDAGYFGWLNFHSRQRIAEARRLTGYGLHRGNQLLKCDGCAAHGGMLEGIKPTKYSCKCRSRDVSVQHS